MLDAVAKLGKDLFGNIHRVLRDEIDVDALGQDQAHDLLDAVDQHLRRVVEEQMRLVEEEDQARLVRIAHFRQDLEQLGHQPQQEGGVEPRVHHQLVGGEHADRTPAVAGGAHDVGDAQCRFAEEMRGALLLQDQQRALDCADGRLRHIAVAGADLGGAFGHVGQQGLEVLQVEQQQAFLVGEAEGDVHDAFLRLGKVHEPRQEQRPHLRDRGADRMALLAEKIPEDDRELLEIIGIELDLLGPLDQEILGLTHHGDAGKVALDVGAEDRHAGVGEALGKDLQAHRLAGAGSAGHQPVAIAVAQQQFLGELIAVVRFAAGADEDAGLFSHYLFSANPMCFPGRYSGVIHERQWSSAPAMEAYLFWCLRMPPIFGNRGR